MTLPVIKNDLPCPRCGRADSVRRVPDVFIGGHMRAVRSFTRVVPGGMLQSIYLRSTETSRKLAPPNHPMPTNYLVAIIFTLIGMWLIWSSLTDFLRFLLPFLLGTGFLTFGVYILARRYLASPEVNEWKKAIQIWETLYYCERNDCVFDTTGKVYPADKIHEFWYEVT